MNNIDKKLKKEAEDVHNEILKKDEIRLNTFLSEKYSNSLVEEKIAMPKKRKYSKLFISLAASLILVIMSVSFFVVLTEKDTPDKKYYKGNEKSIDVVLDQILQEMSNSVLRINSQNVTGMSLTYDSVSNDHLYFLISMETEAQDIFFDAQLFIMVNKHYESAFQLPNELTVIEVNNLRVEYFEFNALEDDLFITESKAKITTNSEVIYIVYNSYSLNTQRNFIDWITGTVSAK